MCYLGLVVNFNYNTVYKNSYQYIKTDYRILKTKDYYSLIAQLVRALH